MTRRLLAASIPLVFTAAVSAQVPLTFEVASIKRNTASDPGGSVRIDPGNRLIVTNVSLAGLVRHAYRTQRWEMVPGGNLPSWMQMERWNIQAKGASDATPAQVSEMFRNLLADRFKLVTKREARRIPVYALVRARADGRLGPQLRVPAADCAEKQETCGVTDLLGNISMTGGQWTDFPRSLSLPAGRYIIDDTGITGLVDLRLTWTQAELTAADGVNDPESLFTALTEQLGLRLVPRQAPVPVLVIYSAERPSED